MTKETEFDLSKERMKLYREMCKILPDFKWGLLFERILNQDKEFIKRLKEKLGVKEVGSAYAEEWIDKLAGKKLNQKKEK